MDSPQSGLKTHFKHFCRYTITYDYSRRSFSTDGTSNTWIKGHLSRGKRRDSKIHVLQWYSIYTPTAV